MDVAHRIRSSWPILLAACLHLTWGGRALADPMYTAIDLGTGSLAYGADSSGNGTVTGSNGLTYTFNPVQNDLPAQWIGISQGVPIVSPAPVWGPDTYGNPDFAYSYSTLQVMNSQGLAVGIDVAGVSGHWDGETAFLTQRQPDGSWGAPTPIWSGTMILDGEAGSAGILGLSSSGQVLGWGPQNPIIPYSNSLYLFDTKTHTLTNLFNLVDAMKWTDSPNLPAGQSPNWLLGNISGAQLDDQGRILVEASHGPWGPTHNVLLIPEGLSPDAVPAPEPATWAIFAILLRGWMACRGFPRARGDRK
jgi:hypothetical protein